MNRISTKKMTLNGLMIALVFLTTYFTKIPGPVGPFNIGDAAIMVAAILLGKNSGFFSGAFGSAVADVAMGYGIFAPVTFIVKGLEGYLIGLIASDTGAGRKAEWVRMVGVIVGAAVMISGYFIAETFVLRFIDPAFGMAKAIEDLPFNLVQGAVSSVIGYAISTVLVRVNVRKHLLD